MITHKRKVFETACPVSHLPPLTKPLALYRVERQWPGTELFSLTTIWSEGMGGLGEGYWFECPLNIGDYILRVLLADETVVDYLLRPAGWNNETLPPYFKSEDEFMVFEINRIKELVDGSVIDPSVHCLTEWKHDGSHRLTSDGDRTWGLWYNGVSPLVVGTGFCSLVINNEAHTFLMLPIGYEEEEEAGVFFITCYRELKHAYNNSRCFGYFRSFERATAAITNDEGSMSENSYYNYAVIEEILEGIHGLSNKKQWYAYGDYHWTPIEEPEMFKNVVNLAIG